MPREKVMPKVTQADRFGEEHTHPAFAMVQFSRVSGSSGKLFGSSLENHNSFVALRISKASVHHDLGRNWYHGANKEYIEVVLSPAQFADLITNMNVGSGVPCTLRYLNGEEIPGIADEHETEHDRIRSKFQEEMDEKVKSMRPFVEKVKALLDKKSLTKDDKKQILFEMESYLKQFSDHAPFLVESFQESAEKVVVSAKAEVEAFMQHAITTAGLEALADGRLPKALTDGSEAFKKDE